MHINYRIPICNQVQHIQYEGNYQKFFLCRQFLFSIFELFKNIQRIDNITPINGDDKFAQNITILPTSLSCLFKERKFNTPEYIPARITMKNNSIIVFLLDQIVLYYIRTISAPNLFKTNEEKPIYQLLQLSIHKSLKRQINIQTPPNEIYKNIYKGYYKKGGLQLRIFIDK